MDLNILSRLQESEKGEMMKGKGKTKVNKDRLITPDSKNSDRNI